MSENQSLCLLLRDCVLPANEARILLAHILEKHYQLPRSALLSRDDMVLSRVASSEWQALVTRRMHGEPIAYILGKKGFHTIDLMVAPGVLIPRPETELLVDIALAEIDKLNRPCKVLDLGTGSGAVGLAIANSTPLAFVVASDQSTDALAIAKQNAGTLKLVSQVEFIQGSWYEALDQKRLFDIIVSNPPYITDQDPHLIQGDLRFEPSIALTDFASGLSCLEIIISGAKQYLKPGGLVAVEHGFDQSEAVVQMMKLAGFGEIQVHHDIAAQERVVSCRKPVQ